ncbi:unnamed protein product [Orchesella dallaii]|uniref:Uncharacterized protein n=1 Tax=Orchesella dallaii TaxID=48710 RepID=A0ABP1PTM1_9HEXA
MAKTTTKRASTSMTESAVSAYDTELGFEKITGTRVTDDTIQLEVQVRGSDETIYIPSELKHERFSQVEVSAGSVSVGNVLKRSRTFQDLFHTVL